MHMRHEKLLNMINQKHRVSVTDLAIFLDVSEVTIRKDLNVLEHQGLLRREHGYASMVASDDITHHLSFNHDLKQKIALRAAEFVHNGETIMIESGACCALMAQELAQTRQGITLITNSAYIAASIRKYASIRTILLGGTYQPESQVTVGPITEKCLQHLQADKLFLGVDGFTPQGFTGHNPARIETLHAMAKKAKRIMVLTESWKFSQPAGDLAFSLDETDSVFTDDLIPHETSQLLHAHKTHIYTISVHED